MRSQPFGPFNKGGNNGEKYNTLLYIHTKKQKQRYTPYRLPSLLIYVHTIVILPWGWPNLSQLNADLIRTNTLLAINSPWPGICKIGICYHSSKFTIIEQDIWVKSHRILGRHLPKKRKEMGGELVPGQVGEENGPTCRIYLPAPPWSSNKNYMKIVASI